MTPRPPAALSLLLLLLLLPALFCLCLRLRLTSGYDYPPLSTLNARPNGCEVLFRALARQPGRRLSRLTDTAEPLPEPKGCTLFLLNYPAAALTREHAAFILRGGRIVLALDTSADPTPAWPLALPTALPASAATDDNLPTLIRSEAAPLLPEFLRSPIRQRYANPPPRWRRVYHRGPHAVILERQAGRGSLVLLGAPDLLSNARLAAAPESAGLLCWLAGNAEHLGFAELPLAPRRTLAHYAWKLRLHGFAAGLLLLFLLFVWRQSGHPLPQRQPPTPKPADQLSGLVRLLRKNLSAQDALHTAWACWRQTAPPLSPETDQAAAAILEHQPPLPLLEGYRRLQALAQTASRSAASIRPTREK